MEKIWIIHAYIYWFFLQAESFFLLSYFAICANWINPYFADGSHFKRTFLTYLCCRTPIKGHRNGPINWRKTKIEKKESVLLYQREKILFSCFRLELTPEKCLGAGCFFQLMSFTFEQTSKLNFKQNTRKENKSYNSKNEMEEKLEEKYRTIFLG